MNVLVWIVQVLLAAVFAWHGLLLLAPPAEIFGLLNAQFALWFRVFLGVAELLAAVGLVLPTMLRIAPWLTPLAAGGVMIVTASATVMHVARGETSSAVTTAVLFLMAAFVAYRRSKVEVVAARA